MQYLCLSFWHSNFPSSSYPLSALGCMHAFERGLTKRHSLQPPPLRKRQHKPKTSSLSLTQERISSSLHSSVDSFFSPYPLLFFPSIEMARSPSSTSGTQRSFARVPCLAGCADVMLTSFRAVFFFPGISDFFLLYKVVLLPLLCCACGCV